jgi:hypothetical protein
MHPSSSDTDDTANVSYGATQTPFNRPGFGWFLLQDLKSTQ